MYLILSEQKFVLILTGINQCDGFDNFQTSLNLIRIFNVRNHNIVKFRQM